MSRGMLVSAQPRSRCRMAPVADQLWTLEEFLAFDDGTDTSYQLLEGCLVAMNLEGAGMAVWSCGWRPASVASCDRRARRTPRQALFRSTGATAGIRQT